MVDFMQVPSVLSSDISSNYHMEQLAMSNVVALHSGQKQALR
jgi:hypothetical protein